MKNYSKLSKIILGFVGIAFLFLILQQIIINPLKIGHDVSPDDINRDDPIIYERYIKHKYLINHINDYDSFIIGASAASNISPEKQLGGKWYAYTGAYMNLFETKRFLQEIISKRQIKNLIITISDENLKIDEISSYKAICTTKISAIKECNILTDFDAFSSIAGSGHNPRKFVSFNDSHLQKLKNANTRKKMAKKFNISLDGDKFDSKKSDTSDKLVKLLCDRGMVDPFDDNPMEVAGSKQWV